MKNSTYSQEYGKVFPDRHIECFVAEQNMVGVALGCAARGRAIAFSSTFACFFSRAFDQIRMAAVSQAAINFCGSHPGVSIGKSRSYLFVIHFSVTMTSALHCSCEHSLSCNEFVRKELDNVDGKVFEPARMGIPSQTHVLSETAGLTTWLWSFDVVFCAPAA